MVPRLEPNRLEIDVGAMRGNVQALRRLVGPDCALYAALKCDAYGFGLVPSAQTLAQAGVDAIAVARVRDAIELREGGLSLPILLYAGAIMTPELAAEIERYELTPTVLDLGSAEVLSRHAGRELPVFIKVDVGQRRIGVEPSGLTALATAVAALPRLRLDGVYTHMTVPGDPVPDGHVERQFGVFEACLAELEAAGLEIRVRMAASSSVLRLTDRMSLNAVDPGRMYFGALADGPATRGLDLRSALRALRSRVLQVKLIEDDPRRPDPPVAVSPGMRVGIIALGTSDGLGAASARDVLVRGVRAPIIEAISLEHCRVDLTRIPDAAVGDEAVVIGAQGGDEITVAEVAAHRGLGAAVHQVAIAIRGSVPRTYVD